MLSRRQKIFNVLKKAWYHSVIYSQELVTGLAWLAFASTFDEARLVSRLYDSYPSAWLLFHVAWFFAGALLLVAIIKPKYFIAAWAFSAVVATSTFVASLGIVLNSYGYSLLFPITWGLFVLLSVTQTIRHYWQDDKIGD